MSRSKLVKGLCLTILVGLAGGGLAHAKGASTESQMKIGDPMPSKNSNFKGIKSPHSSRKEAAKRLKVIHQQKHQQKLHEWAKTHQGHNGHNNAGGAK
jgi:hypothetical protein